MTAKTVYFKIGLGLSVGLPGGNKRVEIASDGSVRLRRNSGVSFKLSPEEARALARLIAPLATKEEAAK